jgi:phosphomannomutase
VFGYEEALGYAAFSLVRDKDGISAAVLFAELAALCKQRGTTVLEQLAVLYRRFGFYASKQRSVAVPGNDGARRVAALLAELRERPPELIGGRAVLERRDYLARTRTWFDGQRKPLSLPPSDVLAYELEGQTRVVVRPSGTEPKLKFYFDRREPVAQGEPIEHAEARATRELTRIEHAVGSWIASL